MPQGSDPYHLRHMPYNACNHLLYYSKLLTLVTANCQSIHNKIDELLATMIEDKIDICVITETWFNDSEASKRKLEEVKAILKQAEYIILNINRPGRGGGVGII